MAKDRFTIPLLCPKCGKTGEAHCEQEDGWAFVKGNTATTVTQVNPGFSRVKKQSHWGNDVNFLCDECGELSAKG
jgi:predicted RNA-binding Zn-ribbon protein involved in translation (DUF1610 family)